jgi:hypothetical protein
MLFRVVWGTSLKSGFASELVEASDADEALVIGKSNHPEWWRPNFAFAVSRESDRAASSPGVHSQSDHSPL